MRHKNYLASFVVTIWLFLYSSSGFPFGRDAEQADACDEEQHFALIEEVKSEDPDALFTYGQYYYRGICVEQSDEQSFQFFMKSAEKGHVTAYYNVALMYHLGIGVEQNTKLAAEMLNLLLDINYLPAGDYICNLKLKYHLKLDELSLDMLIKKYDLNCDP